MTHILKIEEPFADAVLSGEKNFEIRKNDRGFQKGDLIRFEAIEQFSHVKVLAHGIHKKTYEVTYVMGGWGLEKGYVVFGIKEAEL